MQRFQFSIKSIILTDSDMLHFRPMNFRPSRIIPGNRRKRTEVQVSKRFHLSIIHQSVVVMISSIIAFFSVYFYILSEKMSYKLYNLYYFIGFWDEDLNPFKKKKYGCATGINVIVFS